MSNDNSQMDQEHQQQLPPGYYPLISEEKTFSSLDDCENFTFEELQVEQPLSHFTLGLDFIHRPKKDNKNISNIFSFGNDGFKNLIVGINDIGEVQIIYRYGPDRLKQNLYSQSKVTAGKLYQLFVVYSELGTKKDLIIYLNGKNDGQMSLTKSIDIPSDGVFVGSDSLDKMFIGELSDIILLAEPLNLKQIHKITKEKAGNTKFDRKYTVQILTGIDQPVQNAHHLTSPQQSQIKNNSQTFNHTQPLIDPMVLLQDRRLLKASRELIFNLKYLLNTLQMLSPPFMHPEESGDGSDYVIPEISDINGNGINFQFNSISKMMLDKKKVEPQWDSFKGIGGLKSQKGFFYVIELERFMKLIKWMRLQDISGLPVNLNEQDIINLANAGGSLRTFYIRYDEEPLSKIKEKVDVLVYDKFLNDLRSWVLTYEENEIIEAGLFEDQENLKLQDEELEGTEKVLDQQEIYDENNPEIRFYDAITDQGIPKQEEEQLEMIEPVQVNSLELSQIDPADLKNFIIDSFGYRRIEIVKDILFKDLVDIIIGYYANGMTAQEILDQAIKEYPIEQGQESNLQLDSFVQLITKKLGQENEVATNFLKNELQFENFTNPIFESKNPITSCMDFYFQTQSYIFYVDYKNINDSKIKSIYLNADQKQGTKLHHIQDKNVNLFTKEISLNSILIWDKKFIQLAISDGSTIKSFGKSLARNDAEFQYKFQLKFTEWSLIGFNLVIDKNGIQEIIPMYKREPPVKQDLNQSQEKSKKKADSSERYDFPIPKNWNTPKIELVVNHCYLCRYHQATCNHNEMDFFDKFNDLAKMLTTIWSGAKIWSNYDKLHHYENFECYIRGVQPYDWHDIQGRQWLFNKQDKWKFLQQESFFNRKLLAVYDKLVLISSFYYFTNFGDLSQIEKDQKFFKEAYKHTFPRPSDYPITIKARDGTEFQSNDKLSRLYEIDGNLNPLGPTDNQEISPDFDKKQHNHSNGDQMICKNWGCDKNHYKNTYDYTEDENSLKVQCTYHSGTLQPGSQFGTWPECWTCCGKSWLDKGCKLGPHKGVGKDETTFSCVNDGAPPPDVQYKGQRQQRMCGLNFTFKQLNAKGADTCEFSIDGQKHRCPIWPDEEAKKFFIEIKANNPGLTKGEEKKDNLSLSKVGKQSMFYRYIKDYEPFESRETKVRRRLEGDEKDVLKICTNMGCQHSQREDGFCRFTEAENMEAKKNRSKGNCWIHPGKFDFGYIGIQSLTSGKASNLTKTITIGSVDSFLVPKQDKTMDDDRVKWAPQWTCCRSGWFEKGCKKTFHSGIILDEQVVPTQIINAKWPNSGCLKKFKKANSYHYNKGGLVRLMDIDEAGEYFDYLSKAKPQTLNDLKALCELFKLQLLALGSDTSFHFKLLDLLKGRVDQLVVINGAVNKEAFLNWFYMDLASYPAEVEDFRPSYK